MIETILGKLIETNIIVKRKRQKGVDLFLRFEVAEAPVHGLDTDTKQTNIASSTETQTEFPKQDWFSITCETQMEGRLTVDAMAQTDRVYASDRNGDTAQESINIELL